MRVILVEGKQEKVRKNNINKNHQIMEMWGKMNYVDDYAFHICRMLETKSLDSIIQSMEEFCQD